MKHNKFVNELIQVNKIMKDTKSILKRLLERK